MPSMYAKLMSRITESSLMEEDVPVRYCFMMMLAIADPQGYVIGTDIAIARRMNLPVAEFKGFVGELMKPDPDSNSHEEDGRRVIVSDSERGYYVVNYRKYRDTRDEEQRREYMRKYMQDRRAATIDGKPARKPREAGVNSCKQRKLRLAKEEAEADGEVKEETEAGAVAPDFDFNPEWPAGLRSREFAAAWKDYLAYRRAAKMKTPQPMTVTAKLKELDAWGTARAIAAIRATIANGWQGIFEPKNGSNGTASPSRGPTL